MISYYSISLLPSFPVAMSVSRSPSRSLRWIWFLFLNLLFSFFPATFRWFMSFRCLTNLQSTWQGHLEVGMRPQCTGKTCILWGSAHARARARAREFYMVSLRSHNFWTQKNNSLLKKKKRNFRLSCVVCSKGIALRSKKTFFWRERNFARKHFTGERIFPPIFARSARSSSIWNSSCSESIHV